MSCFSCVSGPTAFGRIPRAEAAGSAPGLPLFRGWLGYSWIACVRALDVGRRHLRHGLSSRIQRGNCGGQSAHIHRQEAENNAGQDAESSILDESVGGYACGRCCRGSTHPHTVIMGRDTNRSGFYPRAMGEAIARHWDPRTHSQVTKKFVSERFSAL